MTTRGESGASLDAVLHPLQYWGRKLQADPLRGDVTACFHALQMELHRLLNQHMIDEYRAFRQLLAPLRARYPDAVRQRIRMLGPILQFLDGALGGFLTARESAASIVRQRRGPAPASISDFLAAAYSGMDVHARAFPTDADFRRISSPPAFDPADYPREHRLFVEPLENLQRYAAARLSEDLTGLYVFASGATMDYVPGWSDHDTLAILRRETVSDPARLHRARKHLFRSRRFFHRNDPLQHGHFLITEIDLPYYPETLMPVFMFDHSKVLLPARRQLEVRLRPDEEEAIAFFHGLYVPYADGPLRRLANGDVTPDPAELKSLLHMLFFFPVVYLQARGEHVYKRDVFARIREVHPDWDWHAWNVATRIRGEWSEVFTPGILSTFVARFNPNLAKFMAKREFNRRAPSSLSPNTADWAELARGLAGWIRAGWSDLEAAARRSRPSTGT